MSDARKEICIGEPGTWRCIVLEKLGINVFVPCSWAGRNPAKRTLLVDATTSSRKPCQVIQDTGYRDDD